MAKNIVLIAIALVLSTAGFSQNKNTRQQKNEEKRERIKRMILQEEEGAIIFHRQTVFGIKLITDGYALSLEMGRMKTARKSDLYSLEIGERKHPKEEKIPSVAGTYLTNPYVYGKINNFYFAKLGYAQQRLIGNKGNKNGVAISAIAGGGISLGLLKPYYLKVFDPLTREIRDVKYGENDTVFLSPDVILGATGFSRGFGEIKLTPGVFGKAALRFDYGRYNELVSAIEVGLSLESYVKKMPQMLLNKNRQVYFTAYAAIEFGRRK
jgi:hypothetical protein